MKVQKIFTIDFDLIKKLENVSNKSELVNRLLIEHFNKVDPAKMSKKDYDKLIKTYDIKIKAAEQLEALENE